MELMHKQLKMQIFSFETYLNQEKSESNMYI